MVMDSAPYEAYPYVSFSSEFGYIVVVPDADETTLPAGYKAGTLDIEGKGSIGAYYYGKDKGVCLVYAVNNEGNYGWYLYDVNERTYMRYLGNSEADREEIQVPGTEAQSGDVQKLESQNRMIFWAFLIVVLFLLIVIVILVLSRRNRLEHPEEEEFDEFDDFDDFDDEENAEDDSDTLETNSEDVVKEDEPDGWGDTKSIPNENLPEETETEEADSEESDDEEEWENEIPKKKPKKHHFFGRKKKSSAEEESGIEFIDL